MDMPAGQQGEWDGGGRPERPERPERPDDPDGHERRDSRDPGPERVDAPAVAGVAEVLSEVARSLRDQTDMAEILSAIVAAAVETVPRTVHAGISLVDRANRTIVTMAPTHELVTRIDEIQYQTGEGPCVGAIAQHRTYRTGDLALERRWPQFSTRATAYGARSMLSLRLFADGATLGALNLYSDERDAFDDDAVHTAELFAAHAAVALRGRQRETALTEALDTRQVIGQATGLLMRQYTLTDVVAFQVLIRHSQDRNVKLRVVAAEVVVAANQLAERAGGPGAG